MKFEVISSHVFVSVMKKSVLIEIVRCVFCIFLVILCTLNCFDILRKTHVVGLLYVGVPYLLTVSGLQRLLSTNLTVTHYRL